MNRYKILSWIVLLFPVVIIALVMGYWTGYRVILLSIGGTLVVLGLIVASVRLSLHLDDKAREEERHD